MIIAPKTTSPAFLLGNGRRNLYKLQTFLSILQKRFDLNPYDNSMNGIIAQTCEDALRINDWPRATKDAFLGRAAISATKICDTDLFGRIANSLTSALTPWTSTILGELISLEEPISMKEE